MPTTEQQAFLQLAARAAVSSEQKTGFPAEVAVAQAIFESEWGQRMPGCNCFGIKVDGHGEGAQYVLTHEYIDGSYKEMPLAFERYVNLSACFADHARLLTTGAPYAAAWEQYQKDHKLDAYVRAMAAKYATDPQYAGKILSMANSSNVQLAVQRLRS